jgi:adenylate cyclase
VIDRAKARLRAILGQPIAAGALICHLVLLLLVLLWSLGAMERLELMAYDLGVTWRAESGVRDPRIVVVGITEADIARFDYPIADGLLADLVDRLRTDGARVVAVDLFRERSYGGGANRLARTIAEDGELVWVFRPGDRTAGGLPPPAGIDPSGPSAGFADMVPDEDGVVRRALLYEDFGSSYYTGLALQAAFHYLKASGVSPRADQRQHRYLQLGPAIFVPFEGHDGPYVGADARGYQMLLDSRKGSWAFATYALGDVLDGKVPAAALADRLVIVGTITDTVKDYFDTPLRAIEPHGFTYGVMLHAMIASQIIADALDAAPMTRVVSDAGELAWIWAWTLLGGLCGLLALSAPRLGAALLVGLALLGAAWLAALAVFLWLPVATPALGFAASATLMAGYRSRRERWTRELLMRLFASQVSPAVAEELWRQRQLLFAGDRPRPHRLIATVVFCDIRDFTALAEHMEPQPLMEWLSSYMEAMARTVVEHNGIVDKFIGDAVMAVFGAPIPRRSEAEIDQDAVDAVRCGLAMEEALRRLNRSLAGRGLPEIQMSIGLHTGPVVAGSIGSSERMEYTVVGDTVNIAARLEVAAKQLEGIDFGDSPCRILIGEASWRRLGGRFRGQLVGCVTLRGKSEGVEAWVVLGEAQAAPARREGVPAARQPGPAL